MYASVVHNEEGSTDGWLTLQDASAMLGVAPSTLRRWGDTGRVPMRRTLGGHRRFPQQAITQLVKAAPDTVALARPVAPQPEWSFDERELARQEWHTRFAAG